LDANERETLEHMVLQMETERGLDRSAAVADMRYAFIHRVCDQCVIKPHESSEHLRSQRIDRILTGKYTAIPAFVAIMSLVFFLTFALIGPFLQDLLQSGIDRLADLTEAAMVRGDVNPTIQSLVLSGLFEGVGSVLSFLPVIVTMFFFLSLLEDSGYIARVAFFMDKLLRKIGLSGRSIVPMLVGFGCTVPAVMSARTLPSQRDRKMTILLTPFMSCTAKLPIYGFFAAEFFPGKSWLIVTGLYLLGIVTGITAAVLLKHVHFKGDAVPFVMELPNYRLPSPRSVLQLLWEKAKDFLQRAFTVILVATLVVWFLKGFDFRLNLADNPQDSILAAAAGLLEPLFRPLGLGDWRIVTALLTGFLAKESVVSVVEVFFSSSGGITAAISALSALCMLVFCLLYTPCVAAIAAIRRELGRKWACIVVLWQCGLAWAVALLVHGVGVFLGF
ncbi:MAG: ferrous iron transport protein B, partial [Oscillospiraceae bacterium]|nr:ferrous iron transport protein B [Oscillospiraceae bacterium]